MEGKGRWAVAAGAAVTLGTAIVITVIQIESNVIDDEGWSTLAAVCMVIAGALAVIYVLLTRQTSPTFTFEVGRELGMRQATQCPIVPDRSGQPVPLHSVSNGHPRH
jgi:hypothetical protein